MERLRLPRGVVALGFVSLFMDAASERVHSLLPVFMVGVLGISAMSVGLIEGIAEATAAIVKVFSGTVSDWIGRRKPLVLHVAAERRRSPIRREALRRLPSGYWLLVAFAAALSLTCFSEAFLLLRASQRGAGRHLGADGADRDERGLRGQRLAVGAFGLRPTPPSQRGSCHVCRETGSTQAD